MRIYDSINLRFTEHDRISISGISFVKIEFVRGISMVKCHYYKPNETPFNCLYYKFLPVKCIQDRWDTFYFIELSIVTFLFALLEGKAFRNHSIDIQMK